MSARSFFKSIQIICCSSHPSDRILREGKDTLVCVGADPCVGPYARKMNHRAVYGRTLDLSLARAPALMAKAKQSPTSTFRNTAVEIATSTDPKSSMHNQHHTYVPCCLRAPVPYSLNQKKSPPALHFSLLLHVLMGIPTRTSPSSTRTGYAGMSTTAGSVSALPVCKSKWAP